MLSISSFLSANGDRVASQLSSFSTSVLSRILRESLNCMCCSDDALSHPENFSICSHIFCNRTFPRVHLEITLSETPRPRVRPPVALILRISVCSIVMSDHTPAQNLSVLLRVKKPCVVYCSNLRGTFFHAERPYPEGKH